VSVHANYHTGFPKMLSYDNVYDNNTVKNKNIIGRLIHDADELRPNREKKGTHRVKLLSIQFTKKCQVCLPVF